MFSVIDELAEHLAQWSYSAAFFELSFIPVVRLRSFCKSTKIERFRKKMRQLIRQVYTLQWSIFAPLKLEMYKTWIYTLFYCFVFV